MNSDAQYDFPAIRLRPIISYPRRAQAGKSYLMTIDLQLEAPGAPWPFPEEEYAISCILDTQPYFSYEPLEGREPAIVLHRFGGSYGPAHYRLIAASDEVPKGTIRITFMNPWGIPIAYTELECGVDNEAQTDRMQAITIRLEDGAAGEQTSQLPGELIASDRARSDDFMALRHQSQEKIEKGDYDVFISYNSKDREEVNEISTLLMDNGIAPWFDKRDLSAGNAWWPEAERELRRSKAVAVCVGRSGFGPCQKEEIKIAHEQQKQRGIPVIPVLLAGAEDDFILSSEIKDNTRVDFRKSDPFRRTDPDPLERLIFGITGRPGVKPLRPFVLIATLGESPAVVPAMYDLLTQREGLTIGRVNVLYPEEEEEENTGRAYDLVREALEELDSKKRLRGWPLPFKDANSWKNACKFLKDLFQLLEEQDANARVCLSLAGGRKSMAALMAWVAPFFPCVKKLYHVLDPDEDHFPSLEELESMPHTLRERVLRPGPEQLKRLILVDIPFGEGQHISPRLRQKLRSATYDELALYGATFVHDLMQKDAAIPAPPPVPGKGRESVLIVPLGEFPMVATQLYTLLTKQAQRSIREVVLVYPQSQGIENAARIVKEALEEETRVKCTRVPIRGLRDIDSRDACTRYQQALEDAIDRVRADHQGCIIDLALSGGRKGMTAMTIFAAQKKGIFEVYHTLITDDNLSERIDNETSVSALEKPGLNHAERNARLFLRAYEGEGPYTKFLLFSLPVFPVGDTKSVAS